jgi:hypothetical protein
VHFFQLRQKKKLRQIVKKHNSKKKTRKGKNYQPQIQNTEEFHNLATQFRKKLKNNNNKTVKIAEMMK